jgi:adenylate cyclase
MFLSLYGRLISQGTSHAPIHEHRHIRFGNHVAFWAMAVTVAYTVSYLALGWRAAAAFNLLMLLSYGSSFALNHYNRLRLAPIVVLSTGIVQLAGSSLLFLSAEASTHFWLMVIPAFAFVMVGDRKVAVAISLLSVTMLVLITAISGQVEAVWQVPISETTVRVLQTSSAAGASFFLAIILGLFHRDLEHALELLRLERDRSERLLLNILPPPVAERLKGGSDTIADSYSNVSVLFADFVGFTPLAATLEPAEVVDLLNAYFTAFDEVARRHGVEKIKTIGDAYMAACGVLGEDVHHIHATVCMARDLLVATERVNQERGQSLQIRLGVNCGPVTAGVIGTQKFIYDLWGDTVNVASRMESTGVPGRVQVTEPVRDALLATHRFEARGQIEVKGKGTMSVFLLLDDREAGGSA